MPLAVRADVPDWVQRALGGVLAILSVPVLGVLALAVRLDSPGGSIFVAQRVGEGGRPFGLLKLRTMQQGAAASGPGISSARDPRVTRVGRLLRGARLDELPQLWNVVRGEMRLVGPRPEDPRFVDMSDPVHRSVVEARPGITGVSQLLHADEAERLDGSDPEASYRTQILPVKIAIDAAYLRRRSVRLDAWILARTVLAVAGRPPSEADVEARLGIALLRQPGHVRED